MPCVVLIGGVIGCGKTTFVNYLHANRRNIFKKKDVNSEKSDSFNQSRTKTEEKSSSVCRVIFDELLSIEEQSNMMNTLKGFRNFRVDFLMAAEHFINSLITPKYLLHGPLTKRSFLLLETLEKMNEDCIGTSDVIFLIEDNFYYRSMRYDWFQLARRANIGFCEICLDCPLNLAISRNFSRGYSIPENKIKTMLACLEYPEPEKYKWEKYSLIFNSVGELEISSLKEVIDLIQEASNNPAELMITADKTQAQETCSKNIVHQADNILRKLISKKVTRYQEKVGSEDLKHLISDMVEVRHNLLHNIKHGSVQIPKNLLQNLKNSGIKSVQCEFETAMTDLFEDSWNDKMFGVESLSKTDINFENINLIKQVKNLKLSQL